MPGRDRTGPSGHGSLTGRQMGQCTSTNSPRVTNRFFRNPFRSRNTNRFDGIGGQGHRFRFRNIDRPFQNIALDKTAIENDIKILKEQLNIREEDLKKFDGEQND